MNKRDSSRRIQKLELRIVAVTTTDEPRRNAKYRIVRTKFQPQLLSNVA
jgi:hypothetical protein